MSGKAYFDALIGGTRNPPIQVIATMHIVSRVKWRESGDEYDWLPTPVAYAIYANLCGKVAEPQSRATFGLAIRLMFPDAVKCTRRRRLDGKKMHGWVGIIGPGAERSSDSDQWQQINKKRNCRESLHLQ